MMNKTELIDALSGFINRLHADVASAYVSRGADFGKERFAAWERQVCAFLDQNLPGTSSGLKRKLNSRFVAVGMSESEFSVFQRYKGDPVIAFIESLILDIKNDELHITSKTEAIGDEPAKAKTNALRASRVFIVHGHDEVLKERTARFVEKLGYEAIILHEQASQGKTIIEKIEAHSNVGFAIILYSPDDLGNARADAGVGVLNPRARQNVVFEHGYLMAKLGRSHVAALTTDKVEFPSDVSGVVYIESHNWQIDLAKEMKAAGYDIDYNKVV